MIKPVLAAVSLLIVPAGLIAQTDPDSVHHRNDCRLAAQVITTGHPAPKRDWAYSIVETCPDEGAGAVAHAIGRYRAETDTALLNKVTGPAIRLRDGRIFEAAKRVVADRTATLQARIFGVRVLLWAVSPGGGLYYDAIADTSAMPASCFGEGTPTDLVLYEGIPLPLDFKAQINALAQRIAHDDEEPRAMRRAARCAYFATSRPHLVN